MTRHATAIWSNGKEELYRLHCFADPASAEAFRDHFNGIMFDPRKDRADGKARGAWHRSEPWQKVSDVGPLSIPVSLRD
ncbi:hypothetical protein ABID19_001216 [Mesorhizobium robiniae]|uniref:Uncharacterized protein n=1 Tax=Mesorhizobium robiniae TaxID=559315 RepID=A0ABV2GJ69_9HYPH